MNSKTDLDYKGEPTALERQPFLEEGRALRETMVDADLVVVGGGLAGSCAAVAAARQGLKVTLVQDRPVLGGNASSEVRLWILGATSHMGNNNRWSREGGVVGEFLEENYYRNPEGNPVLVDTLLLEMVEREPNIRLFLNTSVFEVTKTSPRQIKACSGFCAQNGTLYHFRGKYFMDASGDGVIAFMTGAAFRMGAEAREEFGEKMAPDEAYGHLLGHSLYFYSKDVGKPVKFHPPAFAHRQIPDRVTHRTIRLQDHGCRLWWVEYGGRRDTVHDTEEIKWELWRVIYGIWDHIKNSGKFPEARNYTLEWVGTIPGKRESRRFEGEVILRQQDIVEQARFPDVIAHGGWALDLHPADGLYSSLPGCNQWHSKGVYGIPLRAMLPKHMDNLILAGRIISASHVAFGSTRVMATSACGAQGAATAVAVAVLENLGLRKLLEPKNLPMLHRELHRSGQYLPCVPGNDPDDLANTAQWRTSSVFSLRRLNPSSQWIELDESAAMILPARQGPLPEFGISVRADQATTLEWEVRLSENPDNYTPEQTVAQTAICLTEGVQEVRWKPNVRLSEDRYIFLTLKRAPGVSIRASSQSISGIVIAYNGTNKAVGNNGVQNPPEDIGVDRFEFWCPRRRPHPQLIALHCQPASFDFGTHELRNGYARPTRTPGCWIADPDDVDPCLHLSWPSTVTVRTLLLHLDADFDHAMESVLWGHPERVAPMCVRNLRIEDERGRVLARIQDNHHSRVLIQFQQAETVKELRIHLEHPSSNSPAALFSVSVFSDPIQAARTQPESK